MVVDADESSASLLRQFPHGLPPADRHTIGRGMGSSAGPDVADKGKPASAAQNQISVPPSPES